MRIQVPQPTLWFYRIFWWAPRACGEILRRPTPQGSSAHARAPGSQLSFPTQGSRHDPAFDQPKRALGRPGDKRPDDGAGTRGAALEGGGGALPPSPARSSQAVPPRNRTCQAPRWHRPGPCTTRFGNGWRISGAWQRRCPKKPAIRGALVQRGRCRTPHKSRPPWFRCSHASRKHAAHRRRSAKRSSRLGRCRCEASRLRRWIRASSPSPVDDGMTLRAFMPFFVAARQRDYTGQTIVQMRASTRLWTEPMKDRPIRSFISRETLQFLTTLRRLPASHGKGRTRLHPSDAIARADAAEQRGEAPRRRTNKTIKQPFSLTVS